MRLEPLAALLSAAVLLPPAQVYSQSPAAKPTGNLTASNRVDDELKGPARLLLDLSRAVPPEFQADVLTRIAASPLLSETRRRARVIEEAFEVASNAQNQLRMDALPGTDVDSRSGYLALAYEAGLDSLSLKCRAVRALIPVNKPAAIRLFGDVPIPQPRPLTCEDRLVFDLDAYYSLLAEIVRLPLTGEERRGEKPFDLMMREISGIVSPAQVPLIVRAVREAAASGRDMEYFIAALESALAGIAIDYRSFSVSGLELARQIGLLSDTCRLRGVSNVAFLGAARKYFIRELQGTRCGDSAANGGRASTLVRVFNDGIRATAFPRNTVLPEITESEAVPDKIEGAGPSDLLWTDPMSNRLERQVRDLRGFRGKLIDDEWRGRLLELTSIVADWKPTDDMSALDYFHEKCVLLRSLLDVAPDAASREPVLGAYFAFLDQWDFQQNRIEWFLHAREILTILGSAGGPMRSTGIDAELNSVRNPVLALYIKLDALIPADGVRPAVP